MRITKENEQGQLLFWIDINLERIDLSESSGIEGDYGEYWEYESAEVPTKLVEEITQLNSKLNPVGEYPIPENEIENVVGKAMDIVVNSNKANSFFLN